MSSNSRRLGFSVTVLVRAGDETLEADPETERIIGCSPSANSARR